ncbi:TIR domain-containing protein [Paraburkholderia tuberum]|uniref:Predicted nucleotide-binding protein containing TIR-like domain n=1 Tax=Paraburkholderia tuberum TaxID=157910 RepID=A0A1H1H4A3_9BURK|nr:nucleotide-binding protein [Paraburkholderia tuberum]SDR20287.1 Predicted nucleotide-binding protein containing TIR-like domain [Paraburkholderia tuberum]
MNEIATTLAKIAGLRQAVGAALAEKVIQRDRSTLVRESFDPNAVRHYFSQADKLLKKLENLLPELYEDFQTVNAEPTDRRMEFVDGGRKTQEVLHYSRAQLERLVRDLDQILEIRANSELAPPSQSSPQLPNRIFLSHGRSGDWREVQAFVEKDVEIPTLELAQEVNAGQSIIEKLESNSAACDSAVIVMTGDDIDENGQVRARENVIHEIGWFQGRYGRARVCLLHEEAVNIPSNLSGVVYIPFPKGSVQTSFGTLFRELKAMYKK